MKKEMINYVTLGINTTRHTDFDTTHRTKQALYNNMFHAWRQYETYTPSGNETKFELLANMGIHKNIVYSALVRYESKGNETATRLKLNDNLPYNVEDLFQSVFLTFLENADTWEIDTNGNLITSDDGGVIVECYKTISNELYRQIKRHNFKNEYIQMQDGEIINVNSVTALVDYVSIDNLNTNLTLVLFKNRLNATDRKWLEYRLLGCSNAEIVNLTNLTRQNVRTIEKNVRKLWKEWNK